MDWLDYREKLGIGFNDDEKNRYCYIKLITSFTIFRTVLTNREYYDYFNAVGLPLNSFHVQQHSMGAERYDDCVKTFFDLEYNFPEFLSRVVAFINSLAEDSEGNDRKVIYFHELKSKLSEAHIQYEILTDNGKFYFFPKGVEMLDEALVSEPLAWLKGYPISEKAWTKALKEYANEKAEKASDVADLFRKALEAFFQEFFVGSKTLENYKSDYGAYLKAQGVPSTIANNFETLLQAYTNFMNDCAKHHDATSVKVLEYLMYQTGNIMRLLITLKQGEQQDAN